MTMTGLPGRGAGSLVLRSSLTAALGGLLFGFDTAVISGTTDDLRRVFGLGEGALGFTVASALIGTILGALVAGWPADRWGRRGSLIVVAVLYFVSALGSAWPWNWESLLFFRFLGVTRDGLLGVCPAARPPRLGLRAPSSSSDRWVWHRSFRQLAPPTRSVTVRAGSPPHTSHTRTVFSGDVPSSGGL